VHLVELPQSQMTRKIVTWEIGKIFGALAEAGFDHAHEAQFIEPVTFSRPCRRAQAEIDGRANGNSTTIRFRNKL
jgi:hypothetical protein